MSRTDKAKTGVFFRFFHKVIKNLHSSNKKRDYFFNAKLKFTNNGTERSPKADIIFTRLGPSWPRDISIFYYLAYYFFFFLFAKSRNFGVIDHGHLVYYIVLFVFLQTIRKYTRAVLFDTRPNNKRRRLFVLQVNTSTDFLRRRSVHVSCFT